jgi:hypothetical protein
MFAGLNHHRFAGNHKSVLAALWCWSAINEQQSVFAAYFRNHTAAIVPTWNMNTIKAHNRNGTGNASLSTASHENSAPDPKTKKVKSLCIRTAQSH